jgi:hypothetical protein
VCDLVPLIFNDMTVAVERARHFISESQELRTPKIIIIGALSKGLETLKEKQNPLTRHDA